jgi:anti-anti-sigma regulatory factor
MSSSNATIVDLAGDVDVLGMKAVTATLDSALKRSTGAVIVSFEGSTFFESLLLRELMRVAKALALVQRRLLIVMPRGHPGRHIFHVLNLDRKFECFESQAQALRNTSYIEEFRASNRQRVLSWA